MMVPDNPQQHLRGLATAYYNQTKTEAMVTTAKEYYSNTLVQGGHTLVQQGQTIVATSPYDWTINQRLVVSVTVASVWTLLLGLLIVLCRRCSHNKTNTRPEEEDVYTKQEDKEEPESKKTSFLARFQCSAEEGCCSTIIEEEDDEDEEKNLEEPPPPTTTTTTYEMTRPTVTRTPTPRGARLAAAYDNLNSLIQATEPTIVPPGVRLHGALELRQHNLLGQNVRIAVIDSGIDDTHPGFHGAVHLEKHWFRHGTPLEHDDHGTHVAGTIHLMAPAAVLYDYRVFGEAGDMDSDTAVATSIRHAVDQTKCHVIQLTSSVSYPVRTDVRKAIQYAYQRGVHILCAASSAAEGANDTTQDGVTPGAIDPDLSGVAERYSYPAMMKETISVAPLRRDDGFVVANTNCNDTDYGNPLTTTTANNCSSINNYSGIGTNVVSFKPGGGFQTMSGASMAVPHVTGLIACLLSNSEGPSSKALYNSSNGKLRKLLETSHVLDIGDLKTTTDDEDDAARSFYPDGTGGNRFVTYSAAKTNTAEFLDLLSAAVP